MSEFTSYQVAAIRTDDVTWPEDKRKVCAGLGIAGEAGEAAEARSCVACDVATYRGTHPDGSLRHAAGCHPRCLQCDGKGVLTPSDSDRFGMATCGACAGSGKRGAQDGR